MPKFLLQTTENFAKLLLSRYILKVNSTNNDINTIGGI